MARLNLSAQPGVWQAIQDVPRPLSRAQVLIEKDFSTYALIVRVSATCDRVYPPRRFNMIQQIADEAIRTERLDFLDRIVWGMLQQIADKAEQEMWDGAVASARPGEAIPFSPHIWADEIKKSLMYQQLISNLAMTATPAMLGADTPKPAPKKPKPDYNPSNAYRLDTRDLTEETRHATLPILAVVIDL